MASTSFLPTKEAELQAWATNFSTLITATPTVYGLLASDATSLAALVTSFTTALATANTPSTRTEVSITAKDTAKFALVATLRSLARRVQAYPPVTAAQRTALGLPIRNVTPTPVPPPDAAPLVNLMAIGNRVHTIRLADVAAPSRRARPAGTIGAEVYSFVPAPGTTTPPADLEKWRFEGIATKPEFAVDYDGDDVGKTAYIVARWFNRRGEAGPTSAPITGTIAA